MRHATLLAAAALALAASASAQAATTVLTVTSFPSFDESVKIAIPAYQKLHPEIEIKLTSLPYADHHTAMSAALATNANLPDVMALEISYLGRFAESHGLDDLSKPPYNGKPLQPQFHAFAWSQSFDSTGALVALPADVGPGALFYRKDILDKAGVSIEQMTQSWESFIESGKVIREKTGAYTLTGAADIFNTYIRSNLKAGEGVYFAKGGKSLLNTPRFTRAFELALAARKAGIDAKINPWSPEWREAFKRENLATQMMGAWLAGHLADWLNPEGAGKWRASQLPGGAFASWGGSFYAIPKAGQHKKEAWDFIRFMSTNREQQLASFRKMGAYPAIPSAQEKSFLEEPIPFLGGQPARLLWAESARRIPSIPVDKLDPVANEIVSAALDEVLEGRKPVAQALADADAALKRRVRR
jgi:multiple sugar transport system substrate-binding protein